jgi:hypothetical protein
VGVLQVGDRWLSEMTTKPESPENGRGKSESQKDDAARGSTYERAKVGPKMLRKEVAAR